MCSSAQAVVNYPLPAWQQSGLSCRSPAVTVQGFPFWMSAVTGAISICLSTAQIMMQAVQLEPPRTTDVPMPCGNTDKVCTAVAGDTWQSCPLRVPPLPPSHDSTVTEAAEGLPPMQKGRHPLNQCCLQCSLTWFPI